MLTGTPEMLPSVAHPENFYFSAWFHHKTIFKSFREWAELPVYVIVIVHKLTLRNVVIGLRQMSRDSTYAAINCNNFAFSVFSNTRAVQPVATCRQSPYLQKPAIVIVTSFSLWRHSRGSRLRRSQPASQLFSLWRHSHCDVICYWAGHAQRYRRTFRHVTAFNI